MHDGRPRGGNIGSWHPALRACHVNVKVRLTVAEVQVLLETLFDKLKKQAEALTFFGAQVDKAQTGVDCQERLLFLESRFDAIFGKPGSEPKLNPFKQEEILGRLEDVEGQLAAQGDDVHELHTFTHQV